MSPLVHGPACRVEIEEFLDARPRSASRGSADMLPMSTCSRAASPRARPRRSASSCSPRRRRSAHAALLAASPGPGVERPAGAGLRWCCASAKRSTCRTSRDRRHRRGRDRRDGRPEPWAYPVTRGRSGARWACCNRGGTRVRWTSVSSRRRASRDRQLHVRDRRRRRHRSPHRRRAVRGREPHHARRPAPRPRRARCCWGGLFVVAGAARRAGGMRPRFDSAPCHRVGPAVARIGALGRGGGPARPITRRRRRALGGPPSRSAQLVAASSWPPRRSRALGARRDLTGRRRRVGIAAAAIAIAAEAASGTRGNRILTRRQVRRPRRPSPRGRCMGRRPSSRR